MVAEGKGDGELCSQLNPRGGSGKWGEVFVHTRQFLVPNAHVATCSQNGNQLYPRKLPVQLSLTKASVIMLPHSGC